MQHIISARQFDRAFLDKLFSRALRMEQLVKDGHKKTLRRMCENRTLFSVFYEPSTRTRFSFQQAASLLGMTVQATENAGEFSSAIKGETLEDTIRVLAGYHPDVIVLRHPAEGSAKKAADVIDNSQFNTRVINAGDGKGEHPTQALLDLYTIWKENYSQQSGDRIDGKCVVIGGDIRHGRTARSLARLLARCYENVSITFVAPASLQAEDDLVQEISSAGVHVTCTPQLDAHVLRTADVVYWTRVQKERMDPRLYDEVKGRFIIGRDEIDMMPDSAIILHPLPRVDEITTEVDDDPRAAYFRQAENGLYVRMALLATLCKG